MKPTDLFNDLQNKVSEALRNSPARGGARQVERVSPAVKKKPLE